MLTRTAEIVATAAAKRRGVGAFNVITVEHAEAIVAGAEQAGLPVILQISENAVKFHHGRLAPIAAAARAVAATSTVDVGLHLDHVEQVGLLEEALGNGFSSVMFDASTVEYLDNVRATASAAAFCHRHGLWLEGELGAVGGKRGAHAPGVRTDPREARDYVAATGVDALAVAVGSAHAMTTRSAQLDHELIAALRAALPCPLVLHGSSGVPDEDLVAAVRAGMVKINIGTALNIAYTGAIREYLDADPTEVDPRRYLTRARRSMSAAVATALRLLATPAAPAPPPHRRLDLDVPPGGAVPLCFPADVLIMAFRPDRGGGRISVACGSDRISRGGLIPSGARAPRRRTGADRLRRQLPVAEHLDSEGQLHRREPLGRRPVRTLRLRRRVRRSRQPNRVLAESRRRPVDRGTGGGPTARLRRQPREPYPAPGGAGAAQPSAGVRRARRRRGVLEPLRAGRPGQRAVQPVAVLDHRLRDGRRAGQPRLPGRVPARRGA